MYPDPFVVTDIAVTVPSADPSVPPIVTLHLAPDPSPRTGIFVIVLSAVVVQLPASPSLVISIICNAPSASPFPDSAAIGTGIKSGVRKF